MAKRVSLRKGSAAGAIFSVFLRFQVYMMKKLFLFLPAMLLMMALQACIEDSFDTSPSAQPSFSVDELDMGVQFTDNPSPTSQLMIYNRNSKLINLSSVRMRSGQYFRLNVDGQSGSTFADVEIRPNDSIYVFVETTLPEVDSNDPVEISDELEVVTNGVTKLLTIKATAQNVRRHRAELITSDASFGPELPHVVFDTLRVAPGATLTVEAGTSLLFHDKAALIVEGTLLCRGTAENPVKMRGDRTGNVVADISYEVMSNQWEGVKFARNSRGNSLAYTEIINTAKGVTLDSLAELSLLNSRLYNSGTVQLAALGQNKISALGCELSNAASAVLLLGGGEYLFDRCTIANFYLFKWPDMAIVEFNTPDMTKADFRNSIIYGRDTSVGDYGDVTAADIWFRRCMFKEAGADDARYLSCLWDADPMLDYSLTEYTFDYWPLSGSPALNAADPSLNSPDLPAADRHGRLRDATLGAYAPAPLPDAR